MEKTKKSPWRVINIAVVLLHILFPVWTAALMLTIGISGMLFLIALLASLLLGVIYKVVQSGYAKRGLLYGARAVTAAAIIAFYTPAALILFFSDFKPFYELKRMCYIYGVYGAGAEHYEMLLPEKLPENCENYSYRTQGSTIAQDYHASSYLKFYTDTETLDSYAAYYDALSCFDEPDAEKTEWNKEWLKNSLELSEEDFKDSELYWIGGFYPQAVLLSYETGLVAVMT